MMQKQKIRQAKSKLLYGWQPIPGKNNAENIEYIKENRPLLNEMRETPQHMKS